MINFDECDYCQGGGCPACDFSGLVRVEVAAGDGSMVWDEATAAAAARKERAS